jgi:hypothetical protein
MKPTYLPATLLRGVPRKQVGYRHVDRPFLG